MRHGCGMSPRRSGRDTAGRLRGYRLSSGSRTRGFPPIGVEWHDDRDDIATPGHECTHSVKEAEIEGAPIPRAMTLVSALTGCRPNFSLTKIGAAGWQGDVR
jgi:hypothetical protein